MPCTLHVEILKDFVYTELLFVSCSFVLCRLKLSQYAVDIGGVLSVWLGPSVITIFEFLEYIVDIVVMTTTRLIKRLKRGSIVAAASTGQVF